MNSPNSNNQVEETSVTELLQNLARKKASLMRWNTHTMLMFYALLVLVGFLRFEGVNIILVMILATLGLLFLWIMSRIRWNKLQKRFYKEELDNYNQIIAKRKDSSIVSTSGQQVDSPLSNREMEVLALIAEGMLNKQIAVTLGISSQTVKNHISHIMTKLDVDDRTSAVVHAISNGWINVSIQENSGEKTFKAITTGKS